VSGYARARAFNNRVILKPLIDPAFGNSAKLLTALVSAFFPSAAALYFLQTSDNAWMETGLTEIASPAAPREELLVKHLAAMQKVPVMTQHPVNNQRADPAAPIAAKISQKDNL
jgi:hypothetical protein